VLGHYRDLRQGHTALTNPISISVIPPTESHRLHLVAVTSAGYRVYFTVHRVDPYGMPQDIPPWVPGRVAQTLQVAQVRQPPALKAPGYVQLPAL